MDSLRHRLLQQDGIDPSGASPHELTRFRALLAEEQKRARRLGWMAQIPIWGMFLILLGLCVSESLLDPMNVPFITAFGAVVLGLWLLAVPMARRIGMRLQQSRRRMNEIQQTLPEYQDVKPRGIPIVARKGDTRLVCWPRLALLIGVIWLVGALGGNVVWFLLTGQVSVWLILWIIPMKLILAVGLLYNSLTGPLEELQSLDDRNPKYWIPVPRIPVVPVAQGLWKIGKVGWTGLLVFVGMVSVYFFFQGNSVYGRAMEAMRQAATIHAVGYGFQAGQRVQTSEIWYQRDRGTHIQGLHGDQVMDLYDDGRYSYRHTPGQAYAVKKETQQPLLPRELTEPVRYLKWSRRDASRDRQIQGRMYRCYKREDSNALSLMWISWAEDGPRFRAYEEYERVKGQWERVEQIDVEYDLPMDLVMPPGVFEREGIRIVEPEQVLRSQYGLDHALDKTEVLGLTFAVHDLWRCGDYLFLTCSARPTEESLRELKAKGHNEILPGSMTYVGFNLMSWWHREADGSLEEHPYAILDLGCLHQDGVETRWYAFLPRGDWPGRQERLEVCAHVRTHGGLSELRKEKGVAWHEQFRPLLTLAIPNEETPLERLAAQFHDLAPMVVEVTRSSQSLFTSEARSMTRDRFQAHLEDLLAGMRPMQEVWDRVGPDLNIDCVDENGLPIPGVLAGRDMRRTDQGAYHWYDQKGDRLDALVSDGQGHIRLEGQRIFSPIDSRNALACLYAFHEQKNLAAVVRVSEQAFGSPLRVTLQPACRVMARFTDPQSDQAGPKVRARLSTVLPDTGSSGLIVDVLSYTLSSGRFETLLPAGEYELSVYDAADPSEVKAHRRLVVPKGARDLDLGSIEIPAL